MNQPHSPSHRPTPVQGASVGILMLQTRFPRVLGDVGNARTFPFPVLYRVVPGADPDLVVRRKAEGLLDTFVAEAQALVAMGADGIVGNCGFLSLFQSALADAVDVPVATSSLMQVPLIARMLPPKRCVGVLTISAETLTTEHLETAGVALDTPIVGTESGQEFSTAILDDRETMDLEQARRDVLAAARQLVDENPQVGAIVMECTNMSPYAADVRRVTGRPVVTPYSFVCWFQSALSPRRFSGSASDEIGD